MLDPGSSSPPAHQLVGIHAVQRIAGQLAVAAHRTEQRPLGVGSDAGAVDIGRPLMRPPCFSFR